MSVKLRVALVDDESLARQYLAELLSELPGVELVAQFKNGRAAIDGLHKASVDLLFLDINMPGIDGFGVVKRLQSDTLPFIVFATAHDKFALKAFEMNAVDYILKPFEAARVAEAVGRAEELVQARKLLGDRFLAGGLGSTAGSKAAALGAMEALDREAEQSGGTSRFLSSSDLGRLPIKDGQQTRLVEFEAIEWIDAAGDYMCVHAGGETFILRSTMKELEQKLTDAFVRIHRSTIVNLEVVESVDALPKGEALLHLVNGTTLKVSRNFRKAIQHLLA